MSAFRTVLVVQDVTDRFKMLFEPLVYDSDLVGQIVVPTGFQTDFASVPRLPLVYRAWGDRAHREAVIHDYLYRTDSIPAVSREIANQVFLEAMKSRGVPVWIRYPMYHGVCLGGGWLYHTRGVHSLY